MAVDFTNYLVFLLVMMRMTGMLLFNPILARTNVPPMVNTGLAFMISILVSGSVPAPDLPDPMLLTFLYWVAKELLVGLAAGFILRMFMSVFIIAGDKVDMQMGMSMAKAFDPGSNTSIAMSAQIFNVMFYTSFFITNAHLTLIKMTVQSFEILPLGTYVININGFYLIPQLFSNILYLSVQLALPMIVIEIVVTFASGILMKVVPQINIFVLNIQIKLIVGFLVLWVLVVPVMGFVENILQLCFDNIWTVWESLT